MMKITIHNEKQEDAVKALEIAIEKIADETPAWLWDATDLSHVYDQLDESLLAYDRSK